MKGFALGYWYGLVGPAGLPPEISRVLYQAVATALKDPAVQQRIAALGFEPEPSPSPEAFQTTAARDGSQLRTRVQQAGIKPQ